MGVQLLGFVIISIQADTPSRKPRCWYRMKLTTSSPMTRPTRRLYLTCKLIPTWSSCARSRRSWGWPGCALDTRWPIRRWWLALLRAREPFPVNRIAQAGAVAALDDRGIYRPDDCRRPRGPGAAGARFRTTGSDLLPEPGKLRPGRSRPAGPPGRGGVLPAGGGARPRPAGSRPELPARDRRPAGREHPRPGCPTWGARRAASLGIYYFFNSPTRKSYHLLVFARRT